MLWVTLGSRTKVLPDSDMLPKSEMCVGYQSRLMTDGNSQSEGAYTLGSWRLRPDGHQGASKMSTFCQDCNDSQMLPSLADLDASNTEDLGFPV